MDLPCQRHERRPTTVGASGGVKSITREKASRNIADNLVFHMSVRGLNNYSK